MICVRMNVQLGRGFRLIDSYKNIERLRYRINKDLWSICSEVEKSNKEQMILFVDDCFSAITSSIAAFFFSQETYNILTILLEYVWEKIFKKSVSYLTIRIISIVLCVIILIICAISINRFLIFIRRIKKINTIEGIDTNDYVKEFDNIACDSVFVALEYKEVFQKAEESNEKILYFLEAVHYLETAVSITKKLIDNRNNIKTSTNAVGVDAYRIRNIKDVMKDLSFFYYRRLKRLI